LTYKTGLIKLNTGIEKSMKKLILILALLFVASNVFALPGDPPFNCDLNAKLFLNSPDFPVFYSEVRRMIREQERKMLEAKIAPYMEIDPQTGEEIYRRRYQPQVDAALREVEEGERRAIEKAEKYVENFCPNSSTIGLVIRKKYLDLIF
jgi:hypothetical protein